ncbi:uncharacterized protein LOC121945668 [Plectropomus leopardus]|uniref:uncharacterized protein LOC121945668 n=1 Tax=Plectropomus leopardus TaxID=160734 RepID=UPI001C4AD24C|nr:uncharacterized protein LOC121945668 [Plectropomus leopardus]
MTAKKVLFDTLNDLNSEELDKFKSLIELEEDFPPIPRSRLKVANTHDTVELLLDLYRDKCVEVAQRSLRRMNRTDLVQRLSDISSGTKEKQRPLLNQRVETMVFAIELLLETLTDMNDKEFKKFQTAVGQINPERSDLDQWIDMEDIVFFIVKTYGQQSVEMIKEVFKRIRRTDLVQRLSDSSSRPKKKHSVDKHLPTLIHKVATMSAVKELLPETLMDLSDEEFTKFKWLLPLTFFQRSLEITPWTRLCGIDEADRLVDVMMEKYGQQFVEMTEEILMDMKRTDLMQRLSETSSGLQAAGSSAEASGVRATEGEKHFVDEQWPALIQKVETMVPVIELLLQTLADLSDQELEEFNSVLLSETDFDFSDISSMLLVIKDRQVTVFVMVQTHGQQSVETTKEVLKKIERTDLVQRLSDSSSGSKKRHLDEQQSALIHKIAAMATVKHVLLETLNDLSDEEIETFKEFLEWIIEQKSLKDMSSFFSLTENRAEMVDMMIETYSQQSVQLITEVLKKMNRTDLMQRLSMPSSGLKEKQSVDEHQPAGLEKAAEMSAVKEILLETLRGLGFKALEKFKTLLQFTYFQKGLPQISQRRLERAVSAKSIASLIVENQQPVEVTKEVFMDMNRTDLVTKLSVISSRLKDYDPTISVSSPRMDLMKYGFGVRAHCKVLIYKTTSPFLTLHVYLIPAHNPAVQQNLDMMELSRGHKKILKPHPEMPLKMRDCFILSTDVDGAKIFPSEMNLIYECKHPVSFEVIIKNADSDFRLMLTSKQEHRTVWTCEIRKDDYQSSTGSLQEERQSELIRKLFYLSN